MVRPPLRERKKAQTRLDLARAAVRLFQQKGFDACTVDDIVDAADYSRSTFFRYFGSKEDVVFGDLPDRLGQLTTPVSVRSDPRRPRSLANAY